MKLPILRVRDADGNIREIPAIQGPKGDTGPKGDPGEPAPEGVYLPAIESEDYPGCYYRTAENGEREWINPPSVSGEYRTTERFATKPVYQRVFTSGALTSNGNTTFEFIDRGKAYISAHGFAAKDDGVGYYMVPYSANGNSLDLELSTNRITITTTCKVDGAWNNYGCVLCLKYIYY